MLTLVWGENGSGKSAFAERLLAALGESRVYIATMRPTGPEGYARVQRHRAQRAGLHFETLELPLAVADAPVSPEAVVLLEDVSNLLSNNLFERPGAEADVLQDVLALSARCRALVAVSIGGLHEADYRGETRRYVRLLTRLNAQLAAYAQTVVEMKNGIPYVQKGALPDESLLHCPENL